MSFDSSIPPGGGIKPNTKLSDQTEPRKVKGKFRTSEGSSRDVSREDGKPHIPPVTGNGPKERSIDEWEVKIQENEQRFFSKADDIQSEEVDGLEKSHLKEELNALHTCMAEILTRYNQRISELVANDRIMEKDHQKIKGPLIRVFQTVTDQLRELDKSLAPKASKSTRKEVKDVLPIAKSQIAEATKVLADARALLLESTLPELPDAPEVNEERVHPVPKPVSKKVQKPAQKKRFPFLKKKEPDPPPAVETKLPEQRLQELGQRLRRASPEEVQKILPYTVSVLEKLGHQLDEHIRDNPNDPQKIQMRKNFDRSLKIIRDEAENRVTSDKVSSLKNNIRDHIFVCKECIKGITGWQGKVVAKPAKVQKAPQKLERVVNAHLAASDIQFDPLRKLIESLNRATSPADQKQALKALDHYVHEQRERFNRLLPLLQAVDTKCDFEQRVPPPESERFYKAMGQLETALKEIHTITLSANYFSEVKKLDAVLAFLDTFDQELPASMWHGLTETLAQPDKATPHFLNLMCRRILNEETGPLSKRVSLQKFTDICTYLEKVQRGKLDENTDAETIQAFQKVVGDGFSSPEKVRDLMGQARTLEEVRAVGFQLVNWTDMQDKYLDDMCRKLDKVAMDLDQDLESIREGRDKMKTLTRHFTSGTKAVAGKESAIRLSQLETEIKKAVEQIVKERVKHPGSINQVLGDKKACKRLQDELNGELGGVAAIRLTPGASPGEVLRTVDVKLDDTEEERDAINATLNSKKKYPTRLRELLLAGEAKELLDTDKDKQTCHWDPHPKAMIRKFADDFVNSFMSYQRAVEQARQHEKHVNRLIAARDRSETEIERVKEAIPTVRHLKIKSRKRSRKHKVTQDNLRTLTTRVAGLKGKPLKRLVDDTTPIRDLVVNMVKSRQLATEEAIGLLGPLYTVRQAAKGTAPAQPLSSEKAQRTETLRSTLKEMDKKYRWKNLWHRLTRKKRLQAVEHTRALVAICEACPHSPIANAQMLETFIDELEKVKSSHPDYKRLRQGLRDYAQHLQECSNTMTYEQVRG